VNKCYKAIENNTAMIEKKYIDKHNSQILKTEKRNTNPNQTPIVISCGPER
jgi:hypothetical protein